MQPIHYSLILNALALILTAFLAAFFAQPLLIIAVLFVVVMQTHAIQRFPHEGPDDDEDDEDEQPMGFTAKLKD